MSSEFMMHAFAWCFTCARAFLQCSRKWTEGLVWFFGVQMTGLGKQTSMQGGGKSAPSGNASNAGPERPREQRGPVSLLCIMRLSAEDESSLNYS